MWAAYRLPARQGLQYCWERSALALAFLCQGRAAAAAGVECAGLLGRRACVWSWTGQAVQRCPKSFWRASVQVLALFRRCYPQLFAACDERYGAARRYLAHLGGQETQEKFYLAGPETRFVLYRF